MWGSNEKRHPERRSEPISADTALALLTGTLAIGKILNEYVIANLELEGLTRQHEAMKKTRKIAASVKAFFEYVDRDLQAHHLAAAKSSRGMRG